MESMVDSVDAQVRVEIDEEDFFAHVAVGRGGGQY